MRQSLDWFQRAAQVIPGGIYGHVQPAAGLPGVFPYFAQSGRGCRYRDVDGREYLDFMCGFGPVILGYGHPAVEEAAARQRAEGGGEVFNHPSPRMVELAEYLTGRIDFADWAVFAKNGSDLTTWAVQVAREHTGRKKVAMARGAYHGVDAWCTPGRGGVLPEDRALVATFAWNDLDGLAGLFRKEGDDLAAVILTPYHHPGFGPSVLPAPGFWAGVERLCREQETVLILDDIRAGFRLHAGGSHRAFGFTPDLAVYCKALANGYTISAAVGREELRGAAGRVFLTGSYWNNPVAMAAARACLETIVREAVPERLEKMGRRLRAGLEGAARRHGFRLTMTGPESMPQPALEGDPDLFLLQRFCAGAVARGVFFHPHHNWFLGAAHTEQDIDAAVAVAEICWAEMAEERERAAGSARG